MQFKWSHVPLLIVALLINYESTAQEFKVADYNTLFNLKTTKHEDNTRLLQVSFIAQNKEDRKDEIPIYKAEIKFYNRLNEQEILLGTALTSKEGIAQIKLPENQQFLIDKDGNINLSAKFEGTDALEALSEEIILKNLYLNLNLTVVDSVKTVSLEAYTMNSFGEKIPVEETDIAFFVGGMLSKMKIEEGTIVNGKYEFEFTPQLPGDKNSNLKIYAIIEDHDEYATVTQMKTINWGIAHLHPTEQQNTLWSAAAPIWMYIVLTILLVGVWACYIYAIIGLFKLKNDDKNKTLQTSI